MTRTKSRLARRFDRQDKGVNDLVLARTDQLVQRTGVSIAAAAKYASPSRTSAVRRIERGVMSAFCGFAREGYEMVRGEPNPYHILDTPLAQQWCRHPPKDVAVVGQETDAEHEVCHDPDPLAHIRPRGACRRGRRLQSVRIGVLDVIRVAAVERLWVVGPPDANAANPHHHSPKETPHHASHPPVGLPVAGLCGRD